MAYSVPGIRTRRRKNAYRRLARKLILGAIGLALVIALAGGFCRWIHHQWARWMVKVVPVQSGVLQETIQFDALVIHQEQLVLAPAGGKFFPALKEGERVRKGQSLGSMLSTRLSSPGAAVAVTSPGNGLLRLRLDGLEGVLDRESWQNLDLNSLAAAFNPAGADMADDWVAAGGVIASIVDNLVPTWLAVETAADQTAAPWEEGSEYWLAIGQPDTFTRAKLVGQQPSRDGQKLLFELPGFREDLLSQRKVAITVAARRLTGALVDDRSLVEREGRTGVFVLRKGVAEWREVEVVGSVNGQSALRGINEGELVVTNPVWVREGMRLR